ncbi:MAG: hypothetical protein U1C50_01000 [Patescibacteria group bacterium]|nr:hypothetical protein [Patescibacteria group bacterium]
MTKADQAQNPLTDYIKFIFVGYKAIGVTNQDIAAIGGLEKFRSILHDKAASYLISIDGLPTTQENFTEARNRIKEIVASIDKYPPEGGTMSLLK